MCNKLLQHYSSQYLDRSVYWAARDRSSTQRDLLCVIVDTFDRSKLSLPRYPFDRTPKRTVYEMYLRTSIDYCCLKVNFLFTKYHYLPCLPYCASGASVVLTAVVVHGWGCYFYLTPQEGMSAGSNWNWECVPSWAH